MNAISRLALAIAAAGALTITTLGPASADTPVPPASAAITAGSAFLTHFTPNVPNPTTATPEQLAAAAPHTFSAAATADSSAGGSISRSEVLSRARTWIDAGVGYSMTSYRTDENGRYRTDCSGFVSMAWHLPSSSANNYGETTGSLMNVTSSIAKESLKPGDILLNPDSGVNGHVVIFNGWANADHTKYRAYEESGSVGAVDRTVDYPYFAGHGTFSPRRYDNITDDQSASSADMTGDGKADLVVLGTDGTVGLRPGNGGSGFGGGAVVSSGWQNYLGGPGQGVLYFADANGDGKKDMFVASPDGTIGLRLGNGTSFGASTNVSAGWQNYLGQPGQGRLYFADANGDNKADLLVLSPDGTIGLRLGNGTSFGASTTISAGWQNYLADAGKGRLYFADINGDGKTDLLIHGTDGAIGTHLGSGTSFGANLNLTAGWQNYLGQTGQGRLYFADANGDNKADLIVQSTDGTVAIRVGNGTSFNGGTNVSAGWQNNLGQTGQGDLYFE
ncbi:FG-GAP-like repeat-containing protein [Streptomyces sp. NPDC059355]|uniref:C40 family peptidase n=1 Tax=Streptomyces sp. NPDC059355 TaxID=3346811 RepID=UPI00368B56A3